MIGMSGEYVEGNPDLTDIDVLRVYLPVPKADLDPDLSDEDREQLLIHYCAEAATIITKAMRERWQQSEAV